MRWSLSKADTQKPEPSLKSEGFDDAVRRNVAMAKLSDMIAWGRKDSLWPFNFGLSC